MISIVLVDDAPDVRTLVRTRLRLSKLFDVVGEAGSGREAIETARAQQPDLLLLDVSMPDMDGLDALRDLAEVAPTTKVVMFSGFEEQGLADRSRQLGAVDFVEKSVPVDELIDRLVAAARDELPEPRPVAMPAVPESILQEHLERFRAAFDQAAIGMATLTLTLGIVRANAALEAIVGASPGELVGSSYGDLVPLAKREEVTQAIGEVARGERDVVTVEHGLRDRSVVSTVAIVRDSERRPLYLFVQVQDVSDLRRSEESFRLLVESVQDYAIFMLDPEGHVTSWNRGAERAKGYRADEILGQHFSIFYPEQARSIGHPEHELEVAAAEGRYEEEGIRVRKDGSTFVANVVITALRDRAGDLVGFAKVTRDVTERNQLLNDLEQAAEERAKVLAVTAHELRTPVAVVKGFGSTLNEHWDELEDQERRDMIAGLARGGERLSRLVEDLFTAARLETGALEMRITAFDLAAVLQEVVSDHGADVVTCDCPSISVVADRGRVQQMATNYITNAMRYGAPPITVSAETAAGSAVVAVADSGPGVSPELQPELFGKFVSGGSKEGTGLGLFIVRELARAQGGDAWYEPPSRFVFRLPLAP